MLYEHCCLFDKSQSSCETLDPHKQPCVCFFPLTSLNPVSASIKMRTTACQWTSPLWHFSYTRSNQNFQNLTEIQLDYKGFYFRKVTHIHMQKLVCVSVSMRLDYFNEERNNHSSVRAKEPIFTFRIFPLSLSISVDVLKVQFERFWNFLKGF